MKKLGYDNLYCVFCGDRLERKTDQCQKCGKPIGDSKFDGIIRAGAGGIGYSDKTNDPSFKKYKSKNTKVGAVILFIISIIIAAVLLFQKISPLLVAAVLAVIWIFDIIWFMISRIPKKDWEGTVEKKREYQRVVHHSGENDYDTYENVYEMKFRTDNGKKKKLKDLRNRERYDYINIGDRVRFIGRLKNIEKYDKSRDANILCAGCNTLRDAREIYCGRCGCIILKH